MLYEVEARSSRGSLLTLLLDDISDGIVLVDIDGLGPVKASIITSKFSGKRGSQYHGSNSDDRNLKFTFEIHPNWSTQSVADVRAKLYNFFMPRSEVKFTFRTTDNLEVDISGRVETCEPTIFAAEPAVVVSLICFDSDFVDTTLIEIPGMTVSDASTFDITYLGTVETGIKFELNLNRALTEFSIYSTMPDGTVSNLDFAASMADLDTLIIETQPGAKRVTQYRDDNVFASPMYGISPQSSWTEIQPGVNTFRIYAEGAPIPYTLSYYVRYGGL